MVETDLIMIMPTKTNMEVIMDLTTQTDLVIMSRSKEDSLPVVTTLIRATIALTMLNNNSL